MAYYGRDYDEPYRFTDRERGRSFWSRSGYPVGSRYGGEYRGRTDWRGGREAGYGYRYGEEFRGREYDLDYKSRWQTDYGDPFGDRVQQTPIRLIRGEPGRLERGYGRGYDRERRETGYPMGYMPYSRRAGYDTGYRSRWERGYGSDYTRYTDWL